LGDYLQFDRSEKVLCNTNGKKYINKRIAIVWVNRIGNVNEIKNDYCSKFSCK